MKRYVIVWEFLSKVRTSIVEASSWRDIPANKGRGYLRNTRCFYKGMNSKKIICWFPLDQIIEMKEEPLKSEGSEIESDGLLETGCTPDT